MKLPRSPELRKSRELFLKLTGLNFSQRSERKTDFDQPTSSTINCRLCSPLIASRKGADQNGSISSFDVFLEAGPFRTGKQFNQTISPCATLR
jgi:hypothetical protein